MKTLNVVISDTAKTILQKLKAKWNLENLNEVVDTLILKYQEEVAR